MTDSIYTSSHSGEEIDQSVEDVTVIKGKIPSTASSTNKLATTSEVAVVIGNVNAKISAAASTTDKVLATSEVESIVSNAVDPVAAKISSTASSTDKVPAGSEVTSEIADAISPVAGKISAAATAANPVPATSEVSALIEAAVDPIAAVIPDAASDTNQLADKTFVGAQIDEAILSFTSVLPADATPSNKLVTSAAVNSEFTELSTSLQKTFEAGQAITGFLPVAQGGNVDFGSITADDDTGIITLATTNGEPPICYFNGVRVEGLPTTLTFDVPAAVAEGHYYGYIVLDPNTKELVWVTPTPSTLNVIVVSWFYWDADNVPNKLIYAGYEAHTSARNPEAHMYAHTYTGLVTYAEGEFAYNPAEANAAGGGKVSWNGPIVINDDGDIECVIHNTADYDRNFGQPLYPVAKFDYWYIGDEGRYATLGTTDTLVPKYNFVDPATGFGQLIDIPPGQFANVWFFYTTDFRFPVKAAVGRGVYSSIEDAAQEHFLSLHINLPEMFPAYVLVIQKTPNSWRIVNQRRPDRIRINQDLGQGARDHVQLTGRGNAAQHPATAITYGGEIGGYNDLTVESALTALASFAAQAQTTADLVGGELVWVEDDGASTTAEYRGHQVFIPRGQNVTLTLPSVVGWAAATHPELFVQKAYSLSTNGATVASYSSQTNAATYLINGDVANAWTSATAVFTSLSTTNSPGVTGLYGGDQWVDIKFAQPTFISKAELLAIVMANCPREVTIEAWVGGTTRANSDLVIPILQNFETMTSQIQVVQQLPITVPQVPVDGVTIHVLKCANTQLTGMVYFGVWGVPAVNGTTLTARPAIRRPAFGDRPDQVLGVVTPLPTADAPAAYDFGHMALTNAENTFTGDNAFERPVTVPEATADDEAVNLGQARLLAVARASGIDDLRFTVDAASAPIFQATLVDPVSGDTNVMNVPVPIGSPTSPGFSYGPNYRFQVFESSENIQLPDHIKGPTDVWVTLVGGGGSGGTGGIAIQANSYGHAAGGGSGWPGQVKIRQKITVYPADGQERPGPLLITVGAGGAAVTLTSTSTAQQGTVGNPGLPSGVEYISDEGNVTDALIAAGGAAGYGGAALTPVAYGYAYGGDGGNFGEPAYKRTATENNNTIGRGGKQCSAGFGSYGYGGAGGKGQTQATSATSTSEAGGKGLVILEWFE
jgi:hypothetical protein